MNTDLYVRLSAMMFLEYAVWGAWAPVLATRLLGPLKMSGKQTGWIYATLPLASMFAPLLAGQLADKYFDTRWVLAGAHFLGALLLFVAIKRKSFVGLFLTMLLYSTCYAATMPLVNAVMFRHLKEANVSAASIFIWAPVAWALIGYFLTGWRWARKSDSDSGDFFILAAAISVVLGIICLLQPPTPPQPSLENPIFKALAMLKEPSFAAFMLASLLGAGTMQFYFLGTGRFMQDSGLSSKNVPGAMGIAQAAQAVATFFLLMLLWDKLGGKWTMVIGAGCWLLLYLIYMFAGSRLLIVASQVFHGLAYVFFINGGWMYTDAVAPTEIKGSAQALIMLVTTGIGLFLGTQLAGIVMDRYSSDGKFQWRRVWMVPAVITLASLVIMALGVYK